MDVYERVNQPNFKLLPGHRARTLLFFPGCQGVGEKSGSLCKPCPYPRQLRRPGFPHRTWKRKPSLAGSAWLSARNKERTWTIECMQKEDIKRCLDSLAEK